MKPSVKTTKRLNTQNKLNTSYKHGLKFSKAKLIGFLLIFGTIAGICLVYDSFADTRYHTCSPNNCLNAAILGRTASLVKDPNKNNNPVYTLKRTGEAYTTFKPVPRNSRFNVCAIVNGTGAFELMATIRQGFQVGTRAIGVGVPRTFCVKIDTINGAASKNGNSNYVDLSGRVTATSDNVTVSNIFIDLVSGSTPPPSSK